MDNTTTTDFIQDFFDLQVTAYTSLAATVLLLYDTVLTFRAEIDFMWKRKYNPGFILYMTARYGALVSLIAGDVYNVGNLDNFSVASGLLQTIGTLILEGIIMVTTVYFTWTTREQVRELSRGKRQSLLSLFLYQGIFRFGIIFSWDLADAVSRRTENGFLIGVDVSIENAISTILLCRFMLELREFNDKLENISSSQGLARTLSDFRARVRTLNDSIMQDFGASIVPTEEEISTTSSDQNDIQMGHQPHHGDITVDEFPWASGRVEGSLDITPA
ncbi:hypothetical protein M422DRAFT_245424 [Sphaerobolus stellatus SS14]|nr:hypothetical protein M422DRAFT_245424 [Sphaerobolus stellatus SS14]